MLAAVVAHLIEAKVAQEGRQALAVPPVQALEQVAVGVDVIQAQAGRALVAASTLSRLGFGNEPVRTNYQWRGR